MEQFDYKKFYPQGKVMLYSNHPRKTDAKLTKVEAAQLTRRANTVENLTKDFLDIETIFRRIADDGNLVQIMRPTTPYSYGGVMVVAADKSITERGTKMPQDILETKTIFDFSDEAQFEYFAQILACIMVEEEVHLPREYATNGEPVQVVAYENVAVSVSNEQHRIPRSIVLPHSHIIKSGNWFDESHEPVRGFGFRKEQLFLQTKHWFSDFQIQWQNEASYNPNGASSVAKLTLRQTLPFGYTIRTGISKESVREQAKKLASVLAFNHQQYVRFVGVQIAGVNAKRNRLSDKSPLHVPRSVEDSVIPQPTYRMYIYHSNSEICVTISPQFLFPVGAFEAMNIDMDRDTAHPKKFTDEELNQFYSTLEERIQELLKK